MRKICKGLVIIKSKWLMRNSKIDIKKLANECGVFGITTKVLVNRNINTRKDILDFINTDIKNLHNPLLMKDMEKGLDLIVKAIREKRKIVIYGDYDADGVTSTVVLYKALKKCNANMDFHIPNRESEGYGMSKERIKILKDEGAEVILTCDNGISAMEEIDLAKKLGFTVVVTDHHELPFKEMEDGTREYMKPNADAVINPKRSDCNYPFKNLCGAGIAFKFAQGLYEKMDIPVKEANELIEIACIGTICDVVDLVNENRILAKEGLRQITNTSSVGLMALKKVLGIENQDIKSYNIGFQIGPCINATGRLETADLSFEILITENQDRAMELANKLNDLNKERQEMTIKNVEEIIEIIEKDKEYTNKVLVLYKKDVHESIAGIVAGRIKEKYNLPTIVLTGGKEMPKGSGRSIENYNMHEELTKCKELIAKFGGHPMAAGLSIQEENILLLKQKLNEITTLTDEDVTPIVRVDNRLPLEYITFELIEELNKLEPFGKGNEKPLFAEKNIEILEVMILGKEQNTLKLKCKMGTRNLTIDAMGFNKVEKFIELLKENFGVCYKQVLDKPKGLKLDMIFSPAVNEFRGNKNIQLRIEDFRISE